MTATQHKNVLPQATRKFYQFLLIRGVHSPASAPSTPTAPTTTTPAAAARGFAPSPTPPPTPAAPTASSLPPLLLSDYLLTLLPQLLRLRKLRRRLLRESCNKTFYSKPRLGQQVYARNMGWGRGPKYTPLVATIQGFSQLSEQVLYEDDVDMQRQRPYQPSWLGLTMLPKATYTTGPFSSSPRSTLQGTRADGPQAISGQG